MNYVPIAAATAAAARARRLAEEEEEKMTPYAPEDLNGWEFKIVRSYTDYFGKREAVERVCAEESKAGWELLEKFDNNRLRFKRRIESRSKDKYLDLDPYRTHAGMSGGALALTVIGVVAGLAAVIILGVLLFQNWATGDFGSAEGSIDVGLPILAIVVLIAGVVLVRKLKRRKG